MKLLYVVPLVFVLAVVLPGCASSERMTRTSAGVFDEYSAPKSHRTRSEKFQKGSATMGEPRDHKDHNLTGRTKDIINVWPFFFKNQDYVSALWPVIDYDPYGWAVRPFYNQEGDDCSILFPLSSWNTQSKSGWVLNSVFEPGFFSFFPLTWHISSNDTTFFWYSPLLIHSGGRNDPNISYNYASKDFTEFCLAYWGGSNRKVFPEKYDFLYDLGWNWEDKFNNSDFQAKMKYHFHRIGEPVPKDKESFKTFRQTVYDKYGVTKTERYGGFFPLFHVCTYDSGWDCSSFIWLFEMAKKKHGTEVSCLGPVLGSYSSAHFPDSTYNVGKKSFFSVCLLSRFSQTEFYKGNPEKTACNTLRVRSYEPGFNCRSESVLAELKKIHPDIVKDIPETVVNGETFRLYLDELIQKRKGTWQTGIDKSGGFLPVFYFDSRNDGYYEWFSLPILSYYESSPRKEKGSFGLFLPALSWYKTSAREDYSFILAGLGAYCSADRKAQEKRYELPIHKSDSKWVSRLGQQEYEDQYYGLGLFYRGKDRFYVAKPGLNGDPQELKTELIRAVKNFETIQNTEKGLAAREKQNKERVIKTKIEHYQQLIEEERIRIAREENEKKQRKLMEQAAKVRALAEKLNFKLPDDFYTNPGNVQFLGNRIMDELAELRGHEDIGHGIVFRKEKFYNDDYNWRILGFLAGGEKNGEYEKTHVCHLLYRYTKQGDKEETLCFPFIAKGKDGDDTYFSFLWRIFDVETKDGKTSGHILFVPFGD